MPDFGPHGIDVEGAIIDADLLVKYRLVNRAIDTLIAASNAVPRSVALREKLREVYIDSQRLSDAAQQCMDLATLYVTNDKLELANERLLEAKRLDPRVSITARLQALENSGKSGAAAAQAADGVPRSTKSITGDLADINIFDIVQILENSRMTGALGLKSEAINGNIFFNEGRVVDAIIGQKIGLDAFGDLIDLSDGRFEFEKRTEPFQERIETTSNTSLILDVLRDKDEAREREREEEAEAEDEIALGDL